MTNWENIINFFDDIIVADQQNIPLDWNVVQEKLETFGPQAIHRAYYDTGIFSQPVIKDVLLNFPHGLFNQTIQWLMQARSHEYAEETLRKMYGLE